MSNILLTQIFKTNIEPSAKKFVLIALADTAADDGIVWLSHIAICQKTSLNRKTVIRWITVLKNEGFLEDSGERKGKTQQIKVLRIITSPKTEQYQKRNSTKNGTVPKTDSKEAQKRYLEQAQNRATEPLLEPLLEPSSKPPTPLSKFILPDWVPKQPWAEYLEMRKAIKRPLTNAGKEKAVASLEKLRASGHNPEAVLGQSIEKSWNGLFAVKSDSWQKPKGHSPPGKRLTIEQARLERERQQNSGESNENITQSGSNSQV